MSSKKFDTFIDMWRNDYAIEKSIDEQLCVDKDGQPLPWYTYPAIEYLRQFDYHDKKVFEFGVGYSSMFWAKRATSVTAVEDNPQWYERWQNEMKADNLQILLRQDDASYEESLNEKYDVIAIDGKRRLQCGKRALRYLNDGGMIIVDDSDRANTSVDYQQLFAELKSAGLLQVDFFGCCPMNNFTKVTSIFLRRNFAFKTCEKIQPANAIGNLWGKGRATRKKFYNENK